MKRLLRNASVGVAVGATIVGCSFASAFADTPSSTPSPTASSSPSPTASSSPSPTASSSPSPTAGSRSLSSIQAVGASATSKRVTALAAAITKMTGDTYVTSGDKSTILNTLNSDETAMKSLASKIVADTTVSQASADVKSIYTDYRVFAVALPQARLAAGADRLTGSALPKLTVAQAKLEAALSGKFATKSTPTLVADLADMKSQIAAAQSSSASVASDALAVTPADFNSNHAVLSSTRSSEKTAVADAKKARADGKAVLDALRSGRASSTQKPSALSSGSVSHSASI
jgi:hypothetical protein